jgi:hypothetical protein
MTKRPLDARILKMFEMAGSLPDAAQPCFIVDDQIPAKIPLQVLDGPRRNVGHICLDRLTVSGSETAFFMLGSAIIALARQSLASNQETLARIEIEEEAGSNAIGSLSLRTWVDDKAHRNEELLPRARVHIPKVSAWIAPYKDVDVDETELPTFGLLQQPVRMYMAAPATGFLALGKLLAAFALEDVDAVQFESNLVFPGIARQSYELDCLKAQSFAAGSLFGR